MTYVALGVVLRFTDRTFASAQYSRVSDAWLTVAYFILRPTPVLRYVRRASLPARARCRPLAGLRSARRLLARGAFGRVLVVSPCLALLRRRGPSVVPRLPALRSPRPLPPRGTLTFRQGRVCSRLRPRGCAPPRAFVRRAPPFPPSPVLFVASSRPPLFRLLPPSPVSRSPLPSPAPPPPAYVRRSPTSPLIYFPSPPLSPVICSRAAPHSYAGRP